MKSYGMTHIGQKRSINQDYIYYSDLPVGNLPNLYIVADGMGGHKAGDKASSFAVERFIEILASMGKEQPFCLMKDAIEQVNKELFELSKSKDAYEGMGTTFVAASVKDDKLHVMNIGDSRLYIKDECLKQVTFDHSLVEELVRSGQLTKNEARNHPQKNVITRALGVDETVQPDFFLLDFLPGNQILLCSDGLSNMVNDTILENHLEQKVSLEETVNQLINLANEAGGLDNISVVIAKKEER